MSLELDQERHDGDELEVLNGCCDNDAAFLRNAYRAYLAPCPPEARSAHYIAFGQRLVLVAIGPLEELEREDEYDPEVHITAYPDNKLVIISGRAGDGTVVSLDIPFRDLVIPAIGWTEEALIECLKPHAQATRDAMAEVLAQAAKLSSYRS